MEERREKDRNSDIEILIMKRFFVSPPSTIETIASCLLLRAQPRAVSLRDSRVDVS